MNAKADPPICKLSSFRDVVINKFYNEVVVKRNEESKDEDIRSHKEGFGTQTAKNTNKHEKYRLKNKIKTDYRTVQKEPQSQGLCQLQTVNEGSGVGKVRTSAIWNPQ